MKQALVVVDEIKRLKEAIRKTDSQYLKNDYSKNIKYLTGELKYYCKNKGLDFNEVMKEVI